MTAPFRMRLARVRSKDGREIRVFHNRRIDEVRSFYRDAAAGILDRRADMAGFAIVAWDMDGSTSTAIMNVSGRTVPRHLLPEFVRRAVEDRLASPDHSPVMPDDAS